jgi:Kef-type K+ transport system membrane component KefB
METVNIILIIVGLIVILFGIGAFINPNFSRWINAPGSPRLKATIAIVVGIILLIVSVIYKVPN